MTNRELLQAQNRQMYQPRQPIQPQQPKKSTEASPIKPAVKPLPTLAEELGGLKPAEKDPTAEMKAGLKAGMAELKQSPDSAPRKQQIKAINNVKDATDRLDETVERGNKARDESSEEQLEEIKKSNGFLKRIFESDKAKNLIDGGDKHLDTIKDELKGSFGEFGTLTANLLKAGLSLTSKFVKKEDEEPNQKEAAKTGEVEPERKKPVETKEQPAEVAPEKKADVKPTSAPIVETPPEPVKPEAPKAVKIDPQPSATVEAPKAVKVENKPIEVPEPEPIQMPPVQPYHPTQKNLFSMPEPKKYPAMERIWKNKTFAPVQQDVQAAPEAKPVEQPPVKAVATTPKAKRIERMKRREQRAAGVVAPVESETPSVEKEAPKAVRLNRKQRKAEKMEQKHGKVERMATAPTPSTTKPVDAIEAGSKETEKHLQNLDPIKDALEKLVDLNAQQLKSQQDSKLAANSDSLQDLKPKDKVAAPPANDKAAKKSGGLLEGFMGTLLEGIIGVVGGGGIIGTLSKAFKGVFGVIGKFIKPIAGLTKGILSGAKAIPVIGELIMAVTTIFDFFSGWTDAAKILGKDGELLTMWDKFSAGIGAVVGGLASIVDTVLGIFGVETHLEDTIKTGVAKFLSDLPSKLMEFFDSTMKSISEFTSGFGTNFIESLKTLGKTAVKGILSVIPGGDSIAKSMGLDDKKVDQGKGAAAPASSASAPAVVTPAAKTTANFAPKAEANASIIKAEERKQAAPPQQTVVAPTSNNQMVNNTTYTSAPLSTRDAGDSHRYGLAG